MSSSIRFWRRGIPVVVLLLALAVPPLAGSAGFVANDVDAARAARDRAFEIRADVADVVELFELRLALVDEHSWALVNVSVDDIGLEPSDLIALIGIDPIEELARSRSATDAVVNRIGDRALLDAIGAHRMASPDSATGMSISFDALEGEISDGIDVRLSRLGAAAGSIEGGAETAALIDTLGFAGEAQRSLASTSVHLFGSLDPANAESEQGRASRLGLIDETRSYRDALDAFRRGDPPDALVAVADAFASDPAMIRYERVVDQHIEWIVGATAPENPLINDLGALSQLFTDAGSAAAAYTALIEMAADRVERSAGGLVDQAEADSSDTIRSLIALTVITIGFTAVVSYLIVRPSRRLSAGAERIEQGDTGHRIVERGPTELRDAARALNGATATLQLVESQARQMADGTLAADAVTKATKGPLGDSIRSAIETLAESIHEREALRSELAHEASHDGLTGLPNRTAVLARLDEAVARADRSGNLVAVMFLDLDGFKQVNDQLGHQAGDVVLRTVADRFRAASRHGDVIGRLGGDEFLLVAESIADVDEARCIADRMVEEARRPVEIGSVTATVGVSVGVAVCHEHGIEPSELLNAADEAVYAAKDDDARSVVVADFGPVELICPVV